MAGTSLSDILATIQQGVIALNKLGIQIKGSFTNILNRFVTDEANITTNTTSIAAMQSAWTAYTPTLTASVGTFTTASAVGRFKTIGKTVFVTVDISITTVGTGTYPIITLPVIPLNTITVVLYGCEGILTGKAVNGRGSGGSLIIVTYYDNTVPSANATNFVLTGVYEAA